MRPLIVLPTYNESENIERVVRRVRSALPRAGVLVVDDGSPDGTAELAEELGREVGNVDVLRRPAKAGLGSAYREGFAWGLQRGFDVLVEMDADLSHDPDALPGLVAPLAGDVDLVVGSRYMPGGSIPNWRLHRRLLSQGGNIYASLLLGLHATDSTSGFRAYGADILKRIDLGAVRADGYGFQIEMVRQVLEHGGTVTEVPIRFVDRVEGKSKMSTHIVVEALALVTWWALVRLARTVTRTGRTGASARDGGGAGAASVTGVGSSTGVDPATVDPGTGLGPGPGVARGTERSVPAGRVRRKGSGARDRLGPAGVRKGVDGRSRVAAPTGDPEPAGPPDIH